MLDAKLYPIEERALRYFRRALGIPASVHPSRHEFRAVRKITAPLCVAKKSPAEVMQGLSTSRARILRI